MPRALRDARAPGGGRRNIPEAAAFWAAAAARRLSSQRLASFAFSTQPATPTDSFSVCPVDVVSPTRRRFFSRSSSGSSPSVRAMRSRCRSIAQIVCGAPKPRNAPFGGVFVATASASIDTSSQR